MSLLKDFREFAIKGNAIDMAVGIVIGAAFGKIVSSLVADIIMPPLGRIIGAVQFSSLFLNLGTTHYPTLEAARVAGAPTLNYGLFLQSCVDFIIVAFCLFIVVRGISALRRQALPPPVCPPSVVTEDVLLLREIRDALNKR